jgi:hypothetical protein
MSTHPEVLPTLRGGGFPVNHTTTLIFLRQIMDIDDTNHYRTCFPKLRIIAPD